MQGGAAGASIRPGKAAALLAAVVAAAIGPASSAAAAAAFPVQKVAVPMYIFPCNSGAATCGWDRLAAAGESVSMIVFNPMNGPNAGAFAMSAYTAQLARTHAALPAASLLGYVYTSYGGRNASDVKRDVDAYFTAFPGAVDGIFFDEGASGCAFAPYYNDLAAYVRSRYRASTWARSAPAKIRGYESAPGAEAISGGAALVMLNPGRSVPQCYANATDIVVSFESYASMYLDDAVFTPYPWLRDPAQIDGSRVWHIVHSAGPTNVSAILLNTRAYNAGLVFATDILFPASVYGSLPSAAFWNNTLAQMAALNAAAASPAAAPSATATATRVPAASGPAPTPSVSATRTRSPSSASASGSSAVSATRSLAATGSSSLLPGSGTATPSRTRTRSASASRSGTASWTGSASGTPLNVMPRDVRVTTSLTMSVNLTGTGSGAARRLRLLAGGGASGAWRMPASSAHRLAAVLCATVTDVLANSTQLRSVSAAVSCAGGRVVGRSIAAPVAADDAAAAAAAAAAVTETPALRQRPEAGAASPSPRPGDAECDAAALDAGADCDVTGFVLDVGIVADMPAATGGSGAAGPSPGTLGLPLSPAAALVHLAAVAAADTTSVMAGVRARVATTAAALFAGDADVATLSALADAAAATAVAGTAADPSVVGAVVQPTSAAAGGSDGVGGGATAGIAVGAIAAAVAVVAALAMLARRRSSPAATLHGSGAGASRSASGGGGSDAGRAARVRQLSFAPSQTTANPIAGSCGTTARASQQRLHFKSTTAAGTRQTSAAAASCT